jgi:diguanylate cyclase (GGDEF)-like protein
MEAVAPHSAAAINNAIIHEETREDAFTDPLTGLPNLRYFNAFIDEELKRAKRVGYPITMLMMDLERFKEVNDRYGHKKGDVVLLEAGHLLRAQLRKSDVCLRYGGDEFLGILPGVDKELARQTTKRIQAVFDDNPITYIKNESIQIGISIGVAIFPGDGLEPDLLVAIADRDMYRDKRERAGVSGRGASVISFEKHKDQG